MCISRSLSSPIPPDSPTRALSFFLSLCPHPQGCTPDNTVHVDAFLYPDDLVDRLVDEGRMSRAVCVDCGSRNTRMLTFVSHSMAHQTIRTLFVDVSEDGSGGGA